MWKKTKFIIQKLYRFKIKVMFYFGLGWSEVAAIVGLVKDLLIILAAITLLFQVHFSPIWTILTCFIIFNLGIIVGIILVRSGAAAYGLMVNNSINPQLNKLDKIYEKIMENEIK